MKEDHAAALRIESQGFPLAGERIGDGDPATFHGKGL
jgi:hypothetical protein